MKSTEIKRNDEPVGIVISSPNPPVQETVFLAYVWSAAPAPRTTDEAKAG